MTEGIQHLKLHVFIEEAHKNNINFAEITYNCSARDFIDMTVDFIGHENKHNYTFQEFYTNATYGENLSYYVLGLMGKSYIFYEVKDDVEDEVTIWVCYTEKEHRKSGYITLLLKDLVSRYPNKKIVVDTFNEELQKTCRNLGIILFRD